MIPDEKAILISRNKKPIILKCSRYYKNPTLKRRSKIPPYDIEKDLPQMTETEILE